jgi:hypothetical protein
MVRRSSIASVASASAVSAASACIVAPLCLLLVPHGNFTDDWLNNLWMIAYRRAFFAANFSFPRVFNVFDHVGIPQPIFYGPLLYPLLAILSEPLGAPTAVRLACLGLWTMQFWLIYRLARSVGASRGESLAAGALMSWSIYPLTNLYNRCALAEFFGTGLLLCSLCAGGLALNHPLPSRRRAFALLAALLAALAIGSHAPTALVGCPLLVLFAVAASFSGRRLGSLARLALLVLVIVSPWLYAVALFSSRLTISLPNEFSHIYGVWTRFADIDSLPTRFWPVPLADSGGSLTQHLDAQWNFPLALLAGWNAAIALRRRPVPRHLAMIIVSAFAAIVLLALSVSETLQDLLPRQVAAAIQFPYRLVSHANIALLVLLISGWQARPPHAPASVSRTHGNRTILAICLLLSLAALAVKLRHAAAVLRVDPSIDARLTDENLAALPQRFVGQSDYSLQVAARAITDADVSGSRTPLAKLDGPAGLGPLRPVGDVSITVPSATWIMTSVLNFPWDRLILDGRDVPFDEAHNLYFHQTVKVPAGSHTFGYRFDPDPVWVFLYRLSWTLLALLAAATLFCFVFPLPRDKIGEPRDAT